MKNIIGKALWGDGDRDWTITVAFYEVQGSMLVFLFMTSSRQKIVVLKFKYNTMLTISFNINS